MFRTWTIWTTWTTWTTGTGTLIRASNFPKQTGSSASRASEASPSPRSPDQTRGVGRAIFSGVIGCGCRAGLPGRPRPIVAHYRPRPLPARRCGRRGRAPEKNRASDSKKKSRGRWPAAPAVICVELLGSPPDSIGITTTHGVRPGKIDNFRVPGAFAANSRLQKLQYTLKRNIQAAIQVPCEDFSAR